jgi:nucleoside-diphosphate-sugar epimerase
MVSPKADKYPEKTLYVNITSAQNVAKAVLSQPNAEDIKVVYIGSVAQTGSKLPPNQWGRTGDLQKPALYDNYAVSKILAEQAIVDSGIKKWVSLRQSGILYPELIKKGINAITFHVPINGVLEWTTAEDSGQLLANVCEDFVPDEFWNRFYNISSGASFRLTNYEFECQLLKAISCPPPEKIFNTNWFATQNFHGQWYTDADILENYLHFRKNVSCDEYFKYIRKKTPRIIHLAKIVPPCIIKAVMKKIANTKPLGTMYWIKRSSQKKIDAFFGSYDNWKAIPAWKDYTILSPSHEYQISYHGFDETKPIEDFCIEDMMAFAQFHGGKCLSSKMIKGDVSTKLEWQNEKGENFSASPNLVLFGGFWGSL